MSIFLWDSSDLTLKISRIDQRFLKGNRGSPELSRTFFKQYHLNSLHKDVEVEEDAMIFYVIEIVLKLLN